MKKVKILLNFLVCFYIVHAQETTLQELNQKETLSDSYNLKDPVSSYQGIFEMGCSGRLGEFGRSNFKFNFINSIRVPYYSIGIGVGLRIFDDIGDISTTDYSYGLNYHDVQIPVFLDNRIYFSENNQPLYLGFGIGCAFDWMFNVTANLYVCPSIGKSWRISKKTSMITQIVYDFYKMKFLYSYSLHSNRTEWLPQYSNSLGIDLGISF